MAVAVDTNTEIDIDINSDTHMDLGMSMCVYVPEIIHCPKNFTLRLPMSGWIWSVWQEFGDLVAKRV